MRPTAEITIATDGGMLGRGLGPPRTVRLADVDEDLRERARRLLAPAALRAAQRRPASGSPARTEPVTYRMEVVDDEGCAASFACTEAAMSPEQLDVIDALLATSDDEDP